MTTLTIQIPDHITEDVVKYLKEKDVLIEERQAKKLDDLTVEDYRQAFKERALKMRAIAAKHL